MSDRGFRTFNVGPFYLTTMRHTRVYPLRERAWSVTGTGDQHREYGKGVVLCLPIYHGWGRSVGASHRALVIGRRAAYDSTLGGKTDG
jgi:hypothetical protein